MKTRLWLLDINERAVNGTSEALLWGIDCDGHRVLVIDRGFRPYFYLILEGGADVKSVISEVEKILPSTSAVKLEDGKRYFGRRVKAVKVIFRSSAEVVRYSRALAKVKGVKICLEDDIRFSSKYLLDNEVRPCGWCEIDVEKAENELNAGVEDVYLAVAPPKHIELGYTPRLRVLSFSILCYSKRGTPKPERDPIILISTAVSSGEVRQFVAEESEKAVIEGFIDYVNEFDPDVICGYGVNSSDWPYLLERSRRHGLKLLVDRCMGEPHRSVYGHFSVTGRANVDFYEFADEVPEVKLKTLKNIAVYLGAGETGGIEEVEVSELWESVEKRPLLLKHSSKRIQSILEVAKSLLDFALQLSNLVGIPLDHVGTTAVGFRTEFYLMKKAHRLRELIPRRARRPYHPYTGGIVLDPEPGLHEKIVVLDFKSMYPNIMMAKNVSPDTYLKSGEAAPKNGFYEAPEVRHRFRGEPKGLYTAALSSLLEAREEVKRKLATLDPQDPVYRVLDARQKAVKVITNAIYGYAGWVGARWYSRPVAEATTAWGREAIKRTIALAREIGLEVIYGDTDSVFVRNELEKVEKLLEMVRLEMKLEIRPDKVYDAVLFTEAKKRYAGLLADGRLDIVGLEVARGDWTGAAKYVQEKVLEIVLKERKERKATAFVHQYIRELREQKIPLRDLVIWKSLTKPPGKYKVRAPHVEAARLLLKRGWELGEGDKIGYVIVKGDGKLYERAVPYLFASYEELDLEYYEDNQIIPAAHRVLAMFKVSREELKPED